MVDDIQKYKEDIRDILLTALRNVDCYLFLFGSRATKNPKERSDFDIGILAKKSIDFGLRGRLEGYMEGIPAPVDIIDFYNASNDFKKIALRHVEVWKKPKHPAKFKFQILR